MSTNMHCIAHSHNIERVNRQMEHLESTGEVDNVDWAFGHALMLLEQHPSQGLTPDAKNAIAKVKRAYDSNGVSGALVHFDWLQRSLKYLGSGEINDTLETISGKLTD